MDFDVLDVCIAEFGFDTMELEVMDFQITYGVDVTGFDVTYRWCFALVALYDLLFGSVSVGDGEHIKTKQLKHSATIDVTSSFDRRPASQKGRHTCGFINTCALHASQNGVALAACTSLRL